MGAYDLLLDWIYANEKPLPLRMIDVCRIARGYSRVEKFNIERVLSQFFDKEEGGYTQKRVLEEMAKANAQAENNRIIAMQREATKRARKEHESLNDSYTNGQPSQTPDSRLQIDQKKEQEQQHVVPAETTVNRFDEFWVIYPLKKGKAISQKTWKSRKLDAIADQIIADVLLRSATDRQWLDGYIPHGSSYINGRVWEDAIETPSARPSNSNTQSKTLTGILKLEARKHANLDRERDNAGLPETHVFRLGSSTGSGSDRNDPDDVV